MSGTPAAPAARGALSGVALMVAAVAAFSVMEAMVKWLARDYPSPMITWARYSLQTVLMLVLLWPRKGARLLATRRPAMQVVRGAILGLSSVFFFTSLTVMPLAEAGAIAAVTPILVTVLAVRFLHERPPPGTWWALGASFAGVLLIVRPGFAVFTWAAVLPVASSMCYAAYQLMTRRLAGVDDDDSTLFIGALVASLLLSAIVPFFWQPPRGAVDGLLLCAIGAMGWIGHMMLVRALGLAPASTIAPFSYTHIVFALLLGYAVFGNLPDPVAVAGMAAIVATGLWMALRRRAPPRAAD